MKGALQDMSNAELKEITAKVKLLNGDVAKYNYGVLCSCDNTYVIVPISDKHKSKLTLATSMEKIENQFSEYSIEVGELGTIPLVIPC